VAVGSRHRSKCGVLLGLAMAAASACNGDPQVTIRTVTMHSPASCIPGVPALDGGAYATYLALGDFDPPSAPATGHLVGTTGEELPEIGPATRELLIRATESDRAWVGITSVAATGDVNALLLPALTSCALPRTLGMRSASTIAPLTGQRALMVGGRAGDAGPYSSTYLARLDTGDVSHVTTELRTPLSHASVTAFGDDALAAGGVVDSSGSVADIAEVYVSSLGGFDQHNDIKLSEPRARHGAAVLATGETLLVGGVGGPDGRPVLDSMEIVDPATRSVREQNVARLAVARHDPTVLLLASGEVLVAGGFDGADTPVPTLEWFLADVSGISKRARDLIVGAGGRAFIALQAGGALAVIAPPPGASAGFHSVWIIGADGSLEPATPVDGALAQPVLFGGAGGAPVLWTGDRWLRWQPWSGSFAALGALDELPARVSTAVASPDPGLAMWLDESASALVTLRFDERRTYSPLRGPLLLTDTADMAPDRLSASSGPAFDASVGLVLVSGASAFVTDRTYADATIDVDAPTGEPALIVLRDAQGSELEVGGAGCPGALAAGSASSLHVYRTSPSVHWSLSTGPSGTCPAGIGADARVSIGLRGVPTASRSVARNLRIFRR
jgi:hypothetical protein